MKKAFVKLYDHAEDSEHDKHNLYEEAAEAANDNPYLFRKITMAEFDRLGYDEEYKAVWLAGYNRQNGLDGPSSRAYRDVRPPRYAHVTNESACTPS